MRPSGCLDPWTNTRVPEGGTQNSWAKSRCHTAGKIFTFLEKWHSPRLLRVFPQREKPLFLPLSWNCKVLNLPGTTSRLKIGGDDTPLGCWLVPTPILRTHQSHFVLLFTVEQAGRAPVWISDLRTRERRDERGEVYPMLAKCGDVK